MRTKLLLSFIVFFSSNLLFASGKKGDERPLWEECPTLFEGNTLKPDEASLIKSILQSSRKKQTKKKERRKKQTKKKNPKKIEGPSLFDVVREKKEEQNTRLSDVAQEQQVKKKGKAEPDYKSSSEEDEGEWETGSDISEDCDLSECGDLEMYNDTTTDESDDSPWSESSGEEDGDGVKKTILFKKTEEQKEEGD